MKMKKLLPVILILGSVVILGAFYFFYNKDEAVLEVSTPVVTTPEIINEVEKGKAELCFEKFSAPNEYGAIDRYTLRLVLDGDKATGELNLLPAEKDRKIGEFEGTVSAVDKMAMARTADLWWFTSAEGMNVKEELKIKFGEGTASIGFGEMTKRADGAYVYKNPKIISYNLHLTDISCGDLTERVSVEGYLRENISELSPVNSVLGGTWYFVSMTVDLNKNTGTVTYEDGHIQENRTFSYTANDKREVTNLTIK